MHDLKHFRSSSHRFGGLPAFLFGCVAKLLWRVGSQLAANNGQAFVPQYANPVRTLPPSPENGICSFARPAWAAPATVSAWFLRQLPLSASGHSRGISTQPLCWTSNPPPPPRCYSGTCACLGHRQPRGNASATSPHAHAFGLLGSHGGPLETAAAPVLLGRSREDGAAVTQHVLLRDLDVEPTG